MIGIVCAFFHTEGKGFYSNHQLRLCSRGPADPRESLRRCWISKLALTAHLQDLPLAAPSGCNATKCCLSRKPKHVSGWSTGGGLGGCARVFEKRTREGLRLWEVILPAPFSVSYEKKKRHSNEEILEVRVRYYVSFALDIS